MRGKCDDKEGDLNNAHPFPRVSGYKRGSDIMEVRVYDNHDYMTHFSFTKLSSLIHPDNTTMTLVI